jgi:hypothetical protein
MPVAAGPTLLARFGLEGRLPLLRNTQINLLHS